MVKQLYIYNISYIKNQHIILNYIKELIKMLDMITIVSCPLPQRYNDEYMR